MRNTDTTKANEKKMEGATGNVVLMENARVKERRRRKELACGWIRSFLFFVVSFVVLVAFVVLTIYLNDPESWPSFLVENFASLMYMWASLLFIYIVVYLYYQFESRSTLFSLKQLSLIFLIYFLGIVSSYLFGEYVSIYARPVALTAILTYFLRNRREAIFLNVIYAVTMFVIDSFTNFNGTWISNDIFASFILAFACGMIAVFISGFLKTRVKILFSGVLLCLPLELMITLFRFSEVGSFEGYDFVENLVFGAIGGIGSTLLFMAILPVFELVFSCLTVFRLRELTSFDVKLLKRLREEAPATFDHSMVVAQFAEMCAANIGENAELARAAAYYHDVGKLERPEYFTENQKGKENPHDNIPPEISVQLIRNHTTDGKRLIDEARLPAFFGEVALRHHGTMPIRYFYIKAKTMADGDEPDMKEYSYQNTKPQNKITAIIMIADSCEAAIRSYRENVQRIRTDGKAVTPEMITRGIETIIKKLIDERMDLDQFSECDITMKELGVIQTTILNCSTGVYHGRVAYPELNLKKRKFN